uniref:Uncharacterized protein n=1 Tax=Anguilla anguilla TaxID=7936 RepID=A0A0E9VP52_ANGAN
MILGPPPSHCCSQLNEHTMIYMATEAEITVRLKQHDL